MNFPGLFLQYIKDNDLFASTSHLLLAVSGGVDSVVLCELCKEAGFLFSMAHCNFKLREAESERDELFVRSLADRYGCRLFVKSFDAEGYASANNLSVQVAARQLRYDWFDELLQGEIFTLKAPAPQQPHVATIPLISNGSIPAYLLTAHHADDNIETVMMNFFKGTGIAGLRGILPKQGKTIRPLLFARKSDIILYALEHQLPYVEDSSNASDKYTRNYFRNQLIPSIQKVYPQAPENIGKNIVRFREVELLYNQALAAHVKKLVQVDNNEIAIPVLKLKKSVPLETIVYEIIRGYGFSVHQAKEVIALLDAETGKFVMSGSHRILKDRKWLIISLKQQESSRMLVISNHDPVDFELGRLTFEQYPTGRFPLSDSMHVAQLDASKITFPLLLRRYRPGDYFYPLGMSGKKKVGRFLSGQKLSVLEKESIWIIEMNMRILWVVGRRIDDRFKVTPGTKHIFKLVLTLR